MDGNNSNRYLAPTRAFPFGRALTRPLDPVLKDDSRRLSIANFATGTRCSFRNIATLGTLALLCITTPGLAQPTPQRRANSRVAPTTPSSVDSWDIVGNPNIGPTSFLGTTNPQPLVFRTNNIEWARLTSSGSLGLGTIDPFTKFHIHEGIARLTGSNSGGGPMVVFGGTPGGTAPFGQWGIEYTEFQPQSERGLNFWRPGGATGAGATNFVLFLRDDDNHVGVATVNPTAQLTINGNTLIGDPSVVTLPAGYKLYVQDGILTEKVKIATVTSAAWMDRVFAPDYELRSLDEVESFIRANQHLPDVPSGAEVESNGLDLVEINAILLQKIEELTLYTIELNKRVASQETRLRAMDDPTGKSR